MDEDGYLTPEDLESLEDLKLPQELTDQALTELQSLDPPGVGARDLSECLVLQLRRRGACQASIDIASQFLPELGRKHYGPIAKALGITAEEVQAAEKDHCRIGPAPGTRLSAGGTHRLCPAGCLYCGTGGTAESGTQRLLSAPDVHQQLLCPASQGVG